MHRAAWIPTWLVAAVLLAGCGAEPAPPARLIAVAAASDLRPAMAELQAAFRVAHPEVAIAVTYGASGSLYAQLTSQAPFDVFLAADAALAAKLVADGLAAHETLVTYALGRLAVWVPHSSPLDLEHDGLRALVSPAVRKIAVAHRRHAPYGRAAEAALRNAGILEAVEHCLVVGESAAQAAHFAASGSTDAAILPLSLALAPDLTDRGRHWAIPPGTTPEIRQAAVALLAARDPQAARAFCTFLAGPEAGGILVRHGFALPVE